jgi:hypothetical protein
MTRTITDANGNTWTCSPTTWMRRTDTRSAVIAYREGDEYPFDLTVKAAGGHTIERSQFEIFEAAALMAHLMLRPAGAR